MARTDHRWHTFYVVIRVPIQGDVTGKELVAEVERMIDVDYPQLADAKAVGKTSVMFLPRVCAAQRRKDGQETKRLSARRKRV